LSLAQLLLQFLCAGDVAQPAQRTGATAWNDIGLAAPCGQASSFALHGRGHVGASRDYRETFHAVQAEQEVVAVGIFPKAAWYPFLDDETALQSFLDGCGQGDAAMIAMRSATGDQGVSALRECVRHEELQLAGLVAAW
jgi:hypothetical protein